jgi:hypothetical protein
MRNKAFLLIGLGVGLQMVALRTEAQQRTPCFCYYLRPTVAQETRCKDLGHPSKQKMTFTVSCRDDASYPFSTSGLLSDQSGFFSKYVTVKAEDESKIEIMADSERFKIYAFQLNAWDLRDSREAKYSSTGAAQGAIIGGFLFGLPGALLGADIGAGGKLNEQYNTLIVYKDIQGNAKSQVLSSKDYDEASNLRGFLESSSGLKPGGTLGESDLKKKLLERIALLEERYKSTRSKSIAKPWCPQDSTQDALSRESANIKQEIIALVQFSNNIGVPLQSSFASVAGGWNAYLEANPSMKVWAKSNPKQAEAFSRCK